MAMYCDIRDDELRVLWLPGRRSGTFGVWRSSVDVSGLISEERQCPSGPAVNITAYLLWKRSRMPPAGELAVLFLGCRLAFVNGSDSLMRRSQLDKQV
ncbi:hypothetical protein KIN20_017540 [Parelaphostrongylus tenuis]|uniref:Uncharacterized protein n=1 Tax=Parelaphostrongylus tenuis TaxID=148309 RepID=A0AAD5MIN8_PARTN|nr:hypothetical protein KIN20_017540 [Parelaphostrongylus tenuis]